MRELMLVLAMFAALPLASSWAGAVSQEFSVQGVLRDGSGQLQSKMVNVRVRLFNLQTMGTQLGPDYTQMVMAKNGLFTVLYPAATLLKDISSATEVWLEVTADGETFPRQKVTPQLFAQVCAMAETATNAAQLGGVAASGYARKTDLTGGTVTSIQAGTGLTGGTITSSGMLSVVFGGNGTASAAARADHVHALICTTVTNPVGVKCPSGYEITGGGCVAGTALKSSYQIGDTWQCDGTGALTAYARCCRIAAP